MKLNGVLENSFLIEDSFLGFTYFREIGTNNIIYFPKIINKISYERLAFGYELIRAIKYFNRTEGSFISSDIVVHTDEWSSEILDSLVKIKVIISNKGNINNYLKYNQKLLGISDDFYSGLNINSYYMDSKSNNIYKDDKILIPPQFQITSDFIENIISSFSHTNTGYVFFNNLISLPKLCILKWLSEYFTVNYLWDGDVLSILKIEGDKNVSINSSGDNKIYQT